MELQLSLWNIHDWLDERGIEHFYTLEDELPLFQGIRFLAPEVDQDTFAVLCEVVGNNQYHSILTYKNGRIYFRYLQANEAMNLLNELIFVYTEWQKKLTRAVLSQASLQDLLSVSSTFFNLPLIILTNMTISACTDTAISSPDLAQKFSDPSFLQSCYEALKTAHHSDGIDRLRMDGYGQLIMSRIPMPEHSVLLIARAGAQLVTQANLLLFAQIRHAVSLYAKNRDGSVEHDLASFGYAFTAIAEGAVPSADTLRPVLKRLDWQRNDCFQVLCMQLKDPDLQPYLDLLHAVIRRHFPDSYDLVRENHILLFLNISRAARIPDEDDLSEWLPADLLYIGQSKPQTGISDLPLLINQAEQALLMARQTQKTFVNAQAISTQAVLEQFYSDSSLQALVHPAIRLLSELDSGSKAGFGYLNTLEIFLTSGTNVSAASRRLNLHRNTFIHRIERIKELTGLFLNDPEELAGLLLSLIVFDRCAPGEQK